MAVTKPLGISRRSMLVMFTLIAFSTYPGRTALEGGQREITPLSSRSDNWGFITPFVYGEWPEFFGNWRFTLILLQLFLTTLGFLLLFGDLKFGKRKHLFGFWLLFLVSAMFSIQLWRDATLFSLAILGFGFLNESFKRTGWQKILCWILSANMILMAGMFKPIFALCLAPLSLWLIWQSGLRYSVLRNLVLVFSILLTSTSPYFLDTRLSQEFGLKKSYPQQQPILLDLAMNYCWGQSEKIRNDAKALLVPLLKEEYPVESVCAATNPFRWDDLHNDPKKWEFTSPITRITGENSQAVQDLVKNWISLILNNPIDWIQVRLLFLGPALMMSNSFVSDDSIRHEESIIGLTRDLLWNFLSSAVGILDKFRITSLFLLIVCIFLLLTRGRHFFPSSDFWAVRNLYFSLFCATLTCFIAVLTFLAPNGRYVLPYVLLNYVLILRAMAYGVDSKLKSQDIL